MFYLESGSAVCNIQMYKAYYSKLRNFDKALIPQLYDEACSYKKSYSYLAPTFLNNLRPNDSGKSQVILLKDQ